MRNAVLFALVLVIGSTCSYAQSSKPSPDGGQASDKTSDLPTLTGCLKTQMGHYMLIEEDGTSHELSGGARQLKHQVGHQVEVSGKPGWRSVSRTEAGGASSVQNVAVFEVKTVKQVADKCP